MGEWSESLSKSKLGDSARWDKDEKEVAGNERCPNTSSEKGDDGFE
jgi:hypothetical protein